MRCEMQIVDSGNIGATILFSSIPEISMLENEKLFVLSINNNYLYVSDI